MSWSRLTRKNIRRFSDDFEEKREFTGDERVLLGDGYFAFLVNLGIDPNVVKKLAHFNNDGTVDASELLIDESVGEEKLAADSVTSKQLAMGAVEAKNLASSTYEYIKFLIEKAKEREPLNGAKGYHVLPIDFDWNVIPENYDNCIWEIRYVFDLHSATVTIPDGVVLLYEGGATNNGEIITNATIDIRYFCGSVVLTGDCLNCGTTYPTTDLTVGQEFYDTTLNKPVYFNGTDWIDPADQGELKATV